MIDRTDLATQVWELPRDRWKRARWSPKTWAEQVSAYGRLRRLKFDIGIDLQGHSKTAICLRLSGAKRRIAAKATDAFAAKLNPVFGQRPAEMHVVEWNQQVLSAAGDFRLPDAPIMPRRQDAFEAIRRHIVEGKRLATISVSAGQPDKAYLAENWRVVAEALLADGYQVAYLGGPTDSPMNQEGTIDLVGKLPLSETLAAVQCSHLHLAGDTGTGHMAAACGVPVVSVFGPTDPAVFRPYTDNGIVLRDGRETSLVAPERVIRAAHELVRREDAAVSD
ncbi:glycosyl transferase family protein [Fimbriimonas ginsengisoli Gsoil 348]|uniref:Glycosyl transferase family protein n=1 Tax=Fimbriimonas ginsengisoli Gsoil 348 TaxID=661478 RepID=A0A068NL96_FIMGI|nr:glycosyl transferase family protein [Fimbriimonas ginsengisoli Gsoil 348]